MSTRARVDELFRTPGQNAREEILQTTLICHDFYPSAESARRIASLMDGFEHEIQIENNDPVTFDGALSRVRKDVDSLCSDTAVIHELFSLSILDTEVPEGRPSLEDLEAQWMSRWIKGPEGTKRRVDEWSKLIGFTGEYLVSNDHFTY